MSPDIPARHIKTEGEWNQLKRIRVDYTRPSKKLKYFFVWGLSAIGGYSIGYAAYFELDRIIWAILRDVLPEKPLFYLLDFLDALQWIIVIFFIVMFWLIGTCLLLVTDQWKSKRG